MEKEYRGILNLESQTELSSFSVIFEGSVMLEKPGFRGVSHLAEHLICSLYDDLQDAFDENSINWNAWTSSRNVCFFINGLDEYLTPFKDQMLERMLTLDITEERFLHEKKIVIQELLDCFNDQDDAHYLNLYRKLFNHYDAIGCIEDLEELGYEDFMRFMKEQFTKPKLIVNVSKKTPYENENVEFSDKVYKDRLEYLTEPNTEDIVSLNEFNGKSSIIYLSPIVEQKDFTYISFINAMIAGGLKSPLYYELREKRGLCYFVRSSLDIVTPQTGVIGISSVTTAENIKEFEDTVRMVLSDPETYLTRERFEIIKKSCLISKKKSEINRFTSIGKYISPYSDISNILDDLTYEDILEKFKQYYDFDKWYLSVDTEEFK